MANEIQFGYKSGSALTYGAYQPDGTVRTAAATSLPEIGTTGYYTTTDANIAAGDMQIVKEGTDVVGQGIYQPEATVTDKTGYSISGTKQTLDALNDVAATDIVTGGAIGTGNGRVDTVEVTIDIASEVETSAASRTASKADVSALALEATSDLIIQMQEADETFNPTAGTLTKYAKGTSTEILKKNLKDPDGAAVSSTEDIIAATEDVVV